MSKSESNNPADESIDEVQNATSNFNGEDIETDMDNSQDVGEEAINGAEDAAGPTELEIAEAKAQENFDLYMRARAEADNSIKRAQRETENARKFAIEKFAGDMLSVLDSIEMGLQASNDETEVATVLEGMELTKKQFLSVFERFKVEQLNPEGEKFNPELHEALTMAPSPDHEPNTVINVVQVGYSINGRLLRPARVIVAAAS